MSQITYLICKKCESYLFSFSRHDINFCTCDKNPCGIDGGYDYHKFIGDFDNYIICSEPISDCIDKIRERFEWTKRYDKNEKLLKKPITAKLKKLTTDHIVGILLYFNNRLEPYNKDWKTDEVTGSKLSISWISTQQILLEELKYRKLK